MTRYELPSLPYDYGALEPHVSGRIMELHHDKHHATYVKGANATIDKLEAARQKDDLPNLASLERALAFHVSGHVLHSIFWRNLTPDGGGEPTGELAAAITDGFGSFETFQRQMIETAATTMGSGWAALVWEPVGKRLATVQVHDHQSQVPQGSDPIMVIDAWEHAYYLQYENRKKEFFAALWNVWNWDDVAARFEAARRSAMAGGKTVSSD